MIAMVLALTLTSAPALTTAQSETVQKIEKKLLAPCCYAQSVAEHGSDIAVEMRTEITEMIAEGRTEREIVDQYRSIYGDRILIVPDGATGKILFALPVGVSALGCLVLLITLRRMVRSGTEQLHASGPHARPLVNDALREKIERELGEPL